MKSNILQPEKDGGAIFRGNTVFAKMANDPKLVLQDLHFTFFIGIETENETWPAVLELTP